jgi:hypothetical protein
METKLFVNWTKEDFIGYWDSIPYRIKSGMQIYLEDWKANHFAKHLVDLELHKQGKQVNDPKREELVAKCFGIVEEVEEFSDLPEEAKLLNKNNVQKEEPKKVAKPMGRPKKVAEIIEDSSDEEFEGLK